MTWRRITPPGGVLARCRAPHVAGVDSRRRQRSDGQYQLIEGTGSTWSQNAINQWIADVPSDGIQVAYGGGGSSKGRSDFGHGTVDFAVTEIPYQGRDPRTGAVDSPIGRKFAYMPIVAGGTSFMYHLEIGGKLYTGLRLSGETICKIFTGQITNWDNPEITKDNNGFKLPDTQDHPGRPVRRVGHLRAVHGLDGQPVPVDLAAVLRVHRA